MSTVVVPPPEPAEPPPGSGGMGTRFADHLRAGGWFTSILTTIVAFFLGGLVVLVTGHDPLSTYKRDLGRAPAWSGSSRGSRAPTARSRR